MGHRLSRIVTRTGDAGETGLTGGGRVRKAHPRVQAMGDVDELNSQIGVLRSHKLPARLQRMLTRIQHELFNLGGELSMPGSTLVEPDAVAALEADLERLNARLPPLKEFVLPGGGPAAAQAHLARAVCRRAERTVWSLHEREPVNPHTARYLNRLSDLLFVTARTLARSRGGRETTWKKASRARR
jgi:cob(I)alamin adenosyltransferase